MVKVIGTMIGMMMTTMMITMVIATMVVVMVHYFVVWDVVQPIVKKKKNTIGENAVIKKSTKRGKRGKGKKGKCIPLYDTDGQDLYDSDEVTIYFYRDINNPDDKEIFYNLYEFNEYLDSEGIYVSKYETKQLLNRSISHCCIDPSFASFKGEPWLISDSSFGGLSWTVCGDAEELLSQESVLSNNSDELPF